ncbi:hypothetical protein FA15DRAFT_710452 [Coprinopsis marcescibilis]|uniref:Fungal-type protein kinase domain-containing protein n=1 Tax=Coprinopsis marcescibilis TaxID=230819 RepID=A0A5C3KCJ0_COPMA|nr:hypothetical protein FA15DRAFT_710452 [Coprinopsis marcescibilis]
MASFVEEVQLSESATKQQTGTLPFMAFDLLSSSPPRHLLLHDLESLFCILVWGACHYNFSEPDLEKRCKQTKNTPLDYIWFNDGVEGKKWTEIQKAIPKEFAAINKKAIIPLFAMFSYAYTEKLTWRKPKRGRPYEDETMEGMVTYKTFMMEMGEDPELWYGTPLFRSLPEGDSFPKHA